MNEFDEDISIFNGHAELEIIIDRPVAQAWRQWLDVGSWVISHDIEEISHAKRTVGAVIRVSCRRAKELGYPPAHHHYCKIIKLIPERQYVLNTYSEKGGSYGTQMIGFDDTRFVSFDDKVKVTFNCLGEIKADAVAKDPSVINLDQSIKGMSENLKKFKRIVEGR